MTLVSPTAVSPTEMAPSPVATSLPLERVEAEIMILSGHIAAATARVLKWIAEYDRRQGWASWGCRSCAHWLSWKRGDSLHTAREKVRVAHALEQLPVTVAAFEAGELSYSKVRAITRVACGGDDAEWAELARHSTGAELERMAAAVRSSLDRGENRDARTAFEHRQVRRRRRDDGLSSFELLGPHDMIHTLWAAVDVLASTMIDDAVGGSGRPRSDVIAERGGLAAIRADAVLQLAEQAVAADPAGAERGDIGRLSLVADPQALIADTHDGDVAGDAEATLDGSRIAPVIAQRWACDVRVDVLVEDAHGHGRDVGRPTRIIPRRLRRAVHRRDRGMCRFPGCGTSSWLHCHHILPRAHGGHTVLDNLLSLCGFHHRLVHEGGWTVELLDHRTIAWTDPAGTPLTVEPLSGSADVLLHEQRPLRIDTHTIASQWHGPTTDWAFAVAVVAENAGRARQQPQPVSRGRPSASRP